MLCIYYAQKEEEEEIEKHARNRETWREIHSNNNNNEKKKNWIFLYHLDSCK